MATSDTLIQFEHYFSLNAGVFRGLGLNPYFECKTRSTPMEKTVRFIFFQVCFWFLLVTTSLEFLFIVTVAGQEGTLMEICRAFSCAIFDVMGIEEMLLMWRSGQKFNDFILQLETMFPTDHETQKQYSIVKHASDTRLLIKNLSSVFVICIVIWVFGSPCYDVLVCYLSGTTYVFVLPFKMWFPWNQDVGPAFYMALFMQFETIYASVMIILAVNTLFLSVVSQVTLQFNILAKNIRDLDPNDRRKCIELTIMHIRLIDIGKKFSDLISRTMFLNHTLSSMAPCCGLFQVVMAKDTSEVFRFLVYLACVLIQTYNMSYIGDVFIDHSLKISSAIYETDWLSNNKDMRMRFLQIMQRSQKPLQITGLGFFVISLPSFRKILTTSFSYFTLLRSMTRTMPKSDSGVFL